MQIFDTANDMAFITVMNILKFIHSHMHWLKMELFNVKQGGWLFLTSGGLSGMS